jgi:hypothetical protein
LFGIADFSAVRNVISGDTLLITLTVAVS